MIPLSSTDKWRSSDKRSTFNVQDLTMQGAHVWSRHKDDGDRLYCFLEIVISARFERETFFSHTKNLQII
jgi:hypothetical protein